MAGLMAGLIRSPGISGTDLLEVPTIYKDI